MLPSLSRRSVLAGIGAAFVIGRTAPAQAPDPATFQPVLDWFARIHFSWSNIEPGGYLPDLEHVPEIWGVNFAKENLALCKADDFRLLQRLPKLQSILMSDDDAVTSIDIVRNIAGVTTLESLYFNGCTFADEAAGVLAGHAVLNEVEMDSGSLTNAGLAKLAHIKNLKDLSVEQNQLEEGAFAGLDMPQLKKLDIVGALAISDATVLNDIVRFTTLEEFNFVNTAIGDEGFLALQRLPHLKKLSFVESKDYGVSAKAVETFKAARPDVKLEPIIDK